MTGSDSPQDVPVRRRARSHARRSVWARLILLLIVLAAIYLLPKLADLFTPLQRG